jgi:putative membrane protein
MQAMDKKVITKDGEKELVGYLQNHARKQRRQNRRYLAMKRIFQLALIFGLFFFPLSREALSQGRGYNWGMGPGMMGWGYGMGWFGIIFMIIFWIALIIGVIFLVRWVWLSTAKGRTSVEESPLEILKRRYARGEINKEEFEQKKKDLGY